MLPLRFIRNIELFASQGNSAEALERLGRLLSAFSCEEPNLTNWGTSASLSEARTVFTRLASVATALMVDPSVQIDGQLFHRLSGLMPELSHVFLLSGYGSTDHILEAIAARGDLRGAQGMNFADQSDARKFLLCSSVYGSMIDPLLSLFRRAPQVALRTVLGALSSHVTCDPGAQHNRNQLLDALRVTEDVIPTDAMLFDMHRAWTLCSYATTDDRHDAKRYLNRLLTNWLESRKITVPLAKPKLAASDRPTLLVASEVSGGGHVMSRCYEPFLEQLQQRFRVVTVIARDDLGDDQVEWCDELVRFSWTVDKFGDVFDVIVAQQPDIIYYPCIGMRLWPVITCNTRLAPLQIASLGHPATTYSEHIDYMVGGATTAGDEDCYSERLVRLKSPGNLYRLNRSQERYPRKPKSQPAPIRVAICANMLKLNSDFLAACGQIADRVERPLEFHFMPNCIGLKLLVARQQVASVLDGRARFLVFPREPCANYLQHLRDCDIYLGTFPFGGENSMLDALLQGLPAVTLAGAQPHSRLDMRVMQTAGVPDWLITHSVDDYIRAIERLVNDDESREQITRLLVETDLEQRFADEHQEFPTDFVDTIWSIYQRAISG
jgi:hypothetical protein